MPGQRRGELGGIAPDLRRIDGQVPAPRVPIDTGREGNDRDSMFAGETNEAERHLDASLAKFGTDAGAAGLRGNVE